VSINFWVVHWSLIHYAHARAEDDLEREAQKPVLLAPIRVELDTETHRIRDYFTWNVNGMD
jgi:hypothetical protein